MPCHLGTLNGRWRPVSEESGVTAPHRAADGSIALRLCALQTEIRAWELRSARRQ